MTTLAMKLSKIKNDNKSDRLKRSRFFMILEGITGIGQFSLTTGAFLAGFVSFLGGAETLNGTLGVIPSAMGILQIFSVLLIRKGTSRKSVTLKIVIALRTFMAILYFVPFALMLMGASASVMLAGFIVCFILVYTMNALVTPIIGGWIIDVTPNEIRGRYLAKREAISLGLIAVTTIVLGEVLDYYKAAGNEFYGFLIVGGILIILSIINIYSISQVDDISTEVTATTIPFKEEIKAPLQSSTYKRVIIMYVLWNFALFIGATYMAVYMVETLDLSYSYMMIMSVITISIRVMLSGLWGKLADRKSMFTTAIASLIVMSICHLGWGFVTPNNSHIMIPLLHVLGGIAWSGAGFSLFNIQYMFAKDHIRTTSIGVNAAIGGTVGFIAVKIGGWIIKAMGTNTINLSDTIQAVNFGGMRVTFLLSGIMMLVLSLYIKVVIEPMKINS